MKRRKLNSGSAEDFDLPYAYLSLSTAVNAIYESTETKASLALLLRLAVEALSAAGALVLLSPENPVAGSRLTCVAASGLPQCGDESIKISDGQWIEAILAGRTLQLRNQSTEGSGVSGVPRAPFYLIIPFSYSSLITGAVLLWRHNTESLADSVIGHVESIARLMGMLLALEEMGKRARTDELTGAYNPRGLNEVLRVHTSASSGRPYSVIMLEIDDFKHYNNIHGHQAGDKVLRLVSEVLRANARQQDYVTRIGGDEFVVLLCDTDKQLALKIAERFRSSIMALRLDLASTQPLGRLSVSVGVAAYPDDGTTPEEIVAHADQATYKSKVDGKDKITLYGPGTGAAPGEYQSRKILGAVDMVSGLYDRAYLLEQLTFQIRLACHFSRPVWLLLLDLDGLGPINERFGSVAGDRIIREVSLEALGSAQDPCLVCRNQGDEIAVIVPGADGERAFIIAETIRSRIERRRFIVETTEDGATLGVQVPLTVSVGLSCSPGDAEDAQDLLMKSKLALLAAKEQGKNRVLSYSYHASRSAGSSYQTGGYANGT